jgi:hypothetical protein
MSQLTPTVRYLIVCEDVEIDGNIPPRVTLVGLIHAIRSLDDPPFPLLYREIRVFVQLTECRGPAAARIEIHNINSGQVVFRAQTRTVPFAADPLEVSGVVFRLRNLFFQEAGLYAVEFWYN